MSTIVNSDFLRSGQEFSPATSSSSASRKFEEPNAPPLSRHARLERFHDAMLAVLQPKPIEPTPPPSIVNIEFLRAGGGRGIRSNTLPSENQHLQGRHARLENFHNSMLAVHQRSLPTPKTKASGGKPMPSTASAAISISTPPPPPPPSAAADATINIDMLRSGKEFLPATSSTAIMAMPHDRPFKGRHARLEEFYSKTLAAAAAGGDGGPSAKKKQKEQASEIGVTTPINLDFLRSGREFEGPTATTPESKRYVNFNRNKKMKSKNEKLVEFHNQMLQAYTKACNAKLSANPPSESQSSRGLLEAITPDLITVNLDFLRSGSEFQEPTSTSPQVRRYNGFQAKGRHSRLESFHDRMLEQHQRASTPRLSTGH